MRSILNTMKWEVPWSFQRYGGYNNLTTGVPLANDGNMLYFNFPALPRSSSVSSEYLVNVDNYGNIVNRYRTLLLEVVDAANGYTIPVLEERDLSQSVSIFCPMVVDVFGLITARDFQGDVPCGLYFYEIYTTAAGRVPTPPFTPLYWENPIEQPTNRYKSEIFRIDIGLTSKLVPRPRGDFDQTDFNDDFLISGI